MQAVGMCYLRHVAVSISYSVATLLEFLFGLNYMDHL